MRNIDEDALLEVLQYMDFVGTGNSSVLIEDLRAADDPDHDKRLRHHLGTHPSTLKGVANQPVAQEALRGVRRTLWHKFQTNHEAKNFLTVVFVCKRGVHRSVAFAELLRMVTSAYVKAEAAASHVYVSDMSGFWAKKEDAFFGGCHRKTQKGMFMDLG